MFQNIFNKKIENTSRIKCETDDFDVTTSCLESLLIIEDEYFKINTEHMQATHIAMKDHSTEILTEAMGDFANSAVKFFKGLIEKFKEFMKKVFMVITAYLGDFDKFLNTYRDQLTKLNPDFNIKGYNYTFNSSAPKLNRIDAIIDDYNNELRTIDTITKADIIKERDEFMSQTSMNKLRAEVLGLTGEIEREDYIQEAKKIYRDNEEEEIDIHVNKQQLTAYVNSYPILKKLSIETTKERDQVIVLIENMKSFFERSASTYYKGETKTTGMSEIKRKENSSQLSKEGKVERNYDLQKLEVINVFFNFKFAQSKEIGNICIAAMTEKVNALKEALKFHRAVVRKSLSAEKDK